MFPAIKRFVPASYRPTFAMILRFPDYIYILAKLKSNEIIISIMPQNVGTDSSKWACL